MNENNYTSQFNADKNSFLKGNVLQDWEQAGIRSYAAVRNVRLSLTFFFILLSLNAIFRLILMDDASYQVQNTIKMELGGFLIIGILAVITFFVPRWWMVLLTAIAIFPFALGIITGLMAIAFLFMLPSIKRANQELYLSYSEYNDLKLKFADITSGKFPNEWFEIGKIGKFAIRLHFFDNAAVFLSGKNPLNTISNGDANQCIIETDKKGRYFLKKWIVDGKLRNTRITISDKGYTYMEEWLSGGTFANRDKQ